jgi:hypothetical protein
MKDKKIRQFMQLAGQEVCASFKTREEATRKLAAQLLLSEVLEYVIKGLGVTPEFNGTKITDANGLNYLIHDKADKIEMLDGLADVAYTMFWNSCAFGMPLEEAFELVCDNNLEKFVLLEENFCVSEVVLKEQFWHCGQAIVWPREVVKVDVLTVDGKRFAVGKDEHGKVRKPSSYSQLDLSKLVDNKNL